ncbi:hypothetical protein G6F57_016727 [Rhizopus arrhizus]|nr:hypothetical protein G6F57_016727 [Rhizopus arrhizus]
MPNPSKAPPYSATLWWMRGFSACPYWRPRLSGPPVNVTQGKGVTAIFRPFSPTDRSRPQADGADSERPLAGGRTAVGRAPGAGAQGVAFADTAGVEPADPPRAGGVHVGQGLPAGTRAGQRRKPGRADAAFRIGKPVWRPDERARGRPAGCGGVRGATGRTIPGDARRGAACVDAVCDRRVGRTPAGAWLAFRGKPGQRAGGERKLRIPADRGVQRADDAGLRAASRPIGGIAARADRDPADAGRAAATRRLVQCECGLSRNAGGVVEQPLPDRSRATPELVAAHDGIRQFRASGRSPYPSSVLRSPGNSGGAGRRRP